MHSDRDSSPGVRVRPDGAGAAVDRAVLSFLKSEVLHPADFTIRQDGVVRLSPELARRMAVDRGPDKEL
jgi:hypothetical protein